MSSSIAKTSHFSGGRITFSRSVILVALLIVLAFLCLLSIALGTREVSWAEIIGAIQGNLNTVGEAAVTMRIPRTVLAVIAGASLGLAGAVMQGVTRNPLAEPGILGVNIGASFFVVVGLAWFGMNQVQSYVWMAILGSALTAAFVYTIGSMGRGGATPLKLALAGAATSAALSCFTIAVVLPRNDIAGGARSWQIGGVGGATFDTIILVSPFLVVGLVITALTARKLNSLALGDELAAGLGENVVLARSAAGLGAILLCGATTAICGPIGFVGLVVPHFCRLLVGVDHRWLLPFSAVGGACLLLLADIVGRILSRPSELSVGVVTAFIGAPFFIWIVRRQRVREL